VATPTLTKHTLPGAFGDLLIDVRTASRTASGPAVVILHGFKGFKDFAMFPAFAERLARAGFTAVSFNTSGSGVDDAGNFTLPDRFGHNTASAEIDDLLAVVAALDAGRLQVATPTSVGVVGHSRGGGTAILGAVRNPRIAALVTWAAISSFDRWDPAVRAAWREDGEVPILNSRTGQSLSLYTDLLDDIERNARGPLDVEARAMELRIPWLIVHGTGDESVPFTEAETLARAHSRARLLPVEGASHCFGAVHPFRGPTPALEQVFDESLGWFSRHLP